MGIHPVPFLLLIAVAAPSCAARRPAEEDAGGRAAAERQALAAAAALLRGPDTGGSAAPADGLFAEAVSFLAHGDEGGAAAILSALLEQHPGHAAAHRERAGIRLRMGEYAAAAEDFRRAAGHGPADVDLQYGLGTACEREGERLQSAGREREAHERYRDAAEAFKQVLWLEPGYAPALYSIGCVYARLGKRDDAVHYFRRAAEGAGEGSDLERRARYNLRLLGDY
ncbi:MAG: tetratricopeptide repeat protein [bacterium]|nr:tetratricopeptide repeat protein [bacterium]